MVIIFGGLHNPVVLITGLHLQCCIFLITISKIFHHPQKRL